MKVFRINDYEFWAGEDLEQVKAAYLRATGVTEEEAFDDPYEVDPDTHTIRLDSGDVLSFREHLQKLIESGAVFPRWFAVTPDAM